MLTYKHLISHHAFFNHSCWRCNISLYLVFSWSKLHSDTFSFPLEKLYLNWGLINSSLWAPQTSVCYHSFYRNSSLFHKNLGVREMLINKLSVLCLCLYSNRKLLLPYGLYQMIKCSCGVSDTFLYSTT